MKSLSVVMSNQRSGKGTKGETIRQTLTQQETKLHKRSAVPKKGQGMILILI